MEERIYIGTDLKCFFTLTGEGFDMGEDDFEVVLSCGNTTIKVPDKDLIYSPEEQGCYVLIDTTKFPTGVLSLMVRAYVPDDLFETGIRREVLRKDLCYLGKRWDACH